MHLRQPLVAHDQPPVLGQPRQRALDDPAMAAELLAGVDTPTRDARCDTALAAGIAAAVKVIPLITMELVRALARAAPESFDGPHRVEQRLQQARIVPVGRAEQGRQRDSVPVDE